MSQPVLDVGSVPSRVHEVHGYGVPQDMRMPPVGRQISGVRVATEDLIDRRGGHRPQAALPSRKKIRPRPAFLLLEIVPEESPSGRVDRIFT